MLPIPLVVLYICEVLKESIFFLNAHASAEQNEGPAYKLETLAAASIQTINNDNYKCFLWLPNHSCHFCTGSFPFAYLSVF